MKFVVGRCTHSGSRDLSRSVLELTVHFDLNWRWGGVGETDSYTNGRSFPKQPKLGHITDKSPECGLHLSHGDQNCEYLSMLPFRVHMIRKVDRKWSSQSLQSRKSK